MKKNEMIINEMANQAAAYRVTKWRISNLAENLLAKERKRINRNVIWRIEVT
jgi:hypothetical protein